MGAHCITNSSDILSDLNIDSQTNHTFPAHSFSEQEKNILQILGFQPTEISELVKKLNMEISVLSATLTFLEMKGQIKNLGGQQYVLVRKI
jgi:DNA processing protein